MGTIKDTAPGLYEQGGEGGGGRGGGIREASKGDFHDTSISHSDPVKYAS